MSDRLRWILILGCAVVAVLHAPTAASLIVESWSGPYATPRAHAAQQSTAFAPDESRDAAPTVAGQHDGEVGSAQAASNVASLSGELARRL